MLSFPRFVIVLFFNLGERKQKEQKRKGTAKKGSNV